MTADRAWLLARRRVARGRLRWRAWWRLYGLRASMALIALSSVLSCWTLYRLEAQRCSIRVESRSDIRAAINGAVDEGAIQLGADTAKRAEVRDAVSTRVYELLPPPDC